MPRKRKFRLWTPELWDEGFYDSKGRFRVYRPDCPRNLSYNTRAGYCYRYHVVWWLAYGECHPKGEDLHHINGDHTDDRVENLASMPRGEHRAKHRTVPRIDCVCTVCKKVYTIKETDLVHTRKGLYCSRPCVNAGRKEDPRCEKTGRFLGAKEK